MTKLDQYGCDTSIETGAALASWNTTIKGFLCHAASTGPALAQTLKRDPGFALGR